MPPVEYRWRDAVSDAEVNALTVSYGGVAGAGWWDKVRAHSLGWVTARLEDGSLVGFANVAWDGSDHAFLLDPKTRLDHQRQGVGTNLVGLAARRAKEAGCEWLHVDFDDRDRLEAFYFDACGFRPTTAGLIRLTDL